MRRAVDGIGGLTGGATIISERYELLALGQDRAPPGMGGRVL